MGKSKRLQYVLCLHVLHVIYLQLEEYVDLLVLEHATLACNKCLKRFAQVHNDDSCWTNYSGFDTSSWPPRTDNGHRQACREILTQFTQAETKTALQQAESEKGLHYSVFLDLHYFDPIRFPVA